MGINSGNGMGPGQRRPGYQVFKGSAARMNVQNETRRMITESGLNRAQRDMILEERKRAWDAGASPQQVYDLVYKVLEGCRQQAP